jgi:L-rhamnose mutarotase
MKNVKHFVLFVALILSNLSLLAQNPEPSFFIVETMKATPGMDDQYLKAEREVWKRIHQERIKLGLITSWSLYAVRMPSGTDRTYDYVTVTVVQGWKKLENPYGNLLASDVEKLLTKEQLAIANETGKLRNLTQSNVYYGVDFVAADPKATTFAKYQMINFMKVKDEKAEEYYNMETKLVKPMHVEMMKTGGRSAWGLYSRVLGGEGQPFNYVTSDFYNKWEDMAAASDFQKILAKVHPGMTAKAYEKKIFDARSMVNQELWELLDSAR